MLIEARDRKDIAWRHCVVVEPSGDGHRICGRHAKDGDVGDEPADKEQILPPPSVADLKEK